MIVPGLEDGVQSDLVHESVRVGHRLCENFVERDGEGVDVARARVGRAAHGAQELGRHVRQSADHKLLEEAARRPRLHDNVGSDERLPLGSIEVGEDDAPVPVEQHIVALHVAVQHATLVQVCNCSRQLAGERKLCTQRERAARGVQRGEEAPTRINGQDERIRGRNTQHTNWPQHARMLTSLQQLKLLVKAFHVIWSRNLGALNDELQAVGNPGGDVYIRRRTAVHGPHAAVGKIGMHILLRHCVANYP